MKLSVELLLFLPSINIVDGASWGIDQNLDIEVHQLIMKDRNNPVNGKFFYANKIFVAKNFLFLDAIFFIECHDKGKLWTIIQLMHASVVNVEHG